MTNQSNRYSRPKPVVRSRRHDVAAKIVLYSLVSGVLIMAVIGANSLFLNGAETSATDMTITLASPTVKSTPATTVPTSTTPPATNPVVVPIPVEDEPRPATSTSTTTTSTTTSTTAPTTTTTTLPVLAELAPVGLARTKLVKVVLTWQGVRDPSQSYDVGVDYIAAVSESAAGPTAEGYIWAEIPQQTVKVVVDQIKRVYELEVSRPPILTYSLWSQNDCKLYSSVRPEVQVISRCPGMAGIDGKIFDVWKHGVFYPWFSSSRCVLEDEVNAVEMAGLALRTSFAQAHGINVESVQLSQLPTVENPELPFKMPSPSGMDGYELSVVWQACQAVLAG